MPRRGINTDMYPTPNFIKICDVKTPKIPIGFSILIFGDISGSSLG
jgi:hypothetical protein